MATTVTRRKPLPRRGVPYYDVGRGEKMIMPRSGGKAIPYVETPPEKFSPTRALRRAGIRTREKADAGARRASSSARDFGGSLATDLSPGWGALLFYIFLSIVGLALLHNALGGRGPAAIDKILAWLGGGLNRLVSPSDPLVPRGVLPASAASSAAAGPSVTPQTGSVSAQGYVSPFARLAGVARGRIDQGVDFEAGAGNVGKPIGAIGSGTVVSITSDPAGFGPYYVAYRLDAGPQAGQVVYVGHSGPVGLKVGQKVKAGQPVATVQGLGPGAKPGHVEIGFANPAAPNLPLAKSQPNAGRLFSVFAQALGL